MDQVCGPVTCYEIIEDFQGREQVAYIMNRSPEHKTPSRGCTRQVALRSIDIDTVQEMKWDDGVTNVEYLCLICGPGVDTLQTNTI